MNTSLSSHCLYIHTAEVMLFLLYLKLLLIKFLSPLCLYFMSINFRYYFISFFPFQVSFCASTGSFSKRSLLNLKIFFWITFLMLASYSFLKYCSLLSSAYIIVGVFLFLLIFIACLVFYFLVACLGSSLCFYSFCQCVSSCLSSWLVSYGIISLLDCRYFLGLPLLSHIVALLDHLSFRDVLFLYRLFFGYLI